MNIKIYDFYKDQVKFYTKRLKNAKNSLKSYESLGITDQDDLDFYNEIIKCEEENIQRYESKLAEIV